MAANGEVGALRVSLTLDSADFTQRISDVNARLQAVRSEFNAASDGTRGFANTLDGTRAKVDNLTRQMELQQAKVQALRARYQEVAAAQGENSNAALRLAAQYNNAQGALNRMDAQLQESQTRLASLTAEAERNATVWGRMQTQMQGVSQRMQDMGAKMKDAGMNLSMSFGAAFLGIAAPLEDAIKTGAEFESEMAKVGAKAGASADDIKKLSATAEQLAPLAGGATNAATAMDDLAAKGYSVNKIMEAMPSIISAANASGEDLATTSETITGALDAFQMNASQTGHIADVIAMAANKTAAGMMDMQYAFNYAAAPAHMLGMSMEQLASMTGLLANANIKGEQAGTSLREALLRLASPPKAAANELKNLGVATKDNSGNFRNMSDIIGDLNKSMSKMTDAQKAAALTAIFGKTAVSSMMVLIGDGKPKIDELTQSLINSNGASKQAADSMQNNLAGSLKKLNGALDAAKISIEQALAPSLRVLADTLQALVTKFNNLSPGMKQFIVFGAAISAAVLGIIAAIGGLAFFIGSAIEGIGTLGTFLFGSAEGIGALTVAFDVLTGPVGLIITGIVALGVGLYELYQHCKPVQDAINGIGNTIKELFIGIKDLGGNSSSQGTGISILASIGLSPDAVGAIISTVNIVKSAFSTVKQEISNIVQFIQGVGKIASGGAGEGTGISMLGMLGLSSEQITQVQTAINAIKLIITTVLSSIWGVMQQIGNGISAFWQANGAQIMSVVSAVWNVGIVGTIKAVLSVIISVVGSVLGLLRDLWNSHGNQILTIIKTVFSIIGSVISGVLQYITGVFQIALPLIKGIFVGAFTVMQAAVKVAGDIIGGVISIIVRLLTGDFSGALNAAKSTCSKIWSDIKTTFTSIDWGKIGSDMINGLVNGIKSMANGLLNTVKGIAGSIAKAFTGVGPSTPPGFAGGTNFAPGGLAIVGENGPELINLPRGSKVIPTNQTKQMLSGAASNRNIGAASGGNTYNFYPQKAIIDGNDITRAIQRMEALYG